MRRLNLPVPVTDTLVNQAQAWNNQEHTQRTQFANGTLVGMSQFGILDSEDPSTSLPGSGRPFSITTTAGSFAITLSGGYALFGNGELITMPTLTDIVVPTTYLGQRHVLYLVFTEQDHDPRLTEFDAFKATWTGPPSDALEYVRIARMTDYTSLGLATRQSQTIPLAVITPTNTGLFVDQTRSELSSNRPWASVLDIVHRSYVGSGVVTSNNPHGMSPADMSVSAGTSLYDFLLPHGLIVARDVGLAGVPGHLCTDTVVAFGVVQDITGSVTGVSGAYYFSTSKFPTQLLSVVGATSGKVLAAAQVPAQNIIMFLAEDEWDTVESLTVTYATVTAAAPPTGTSLTVFPAVNPAEYETVVSGGDSVSEVVGDLGFATCGPYPFQCHVYLDGEGNLQRIPATLKCDIALNDALGLQPVDIQPAVASKLRIGLRSAVSNPALDIKIEITGVRADDSVIVTETLSFGPSYVDSAIPAAAENPNQWVYTTTTFSSVESYRVATRLSDGPNSAITIQALYDSNDITLASNMPVAHVFWDGLRMSRIQDARPIRVSATSTQTIELAASAASFAESTLIRSPAVSKAVLGAWYEDFENPVLISDDSEIVRWSVGLGVGDVYQSRPIPVRPHVDDAVSFRAWPVESEQGFTGDIRFYTDAGVWTSWLPLATLASPRFNYTFPAGQRLIKWQVRCQGPVKGMMFVYLAAGDALPPTMIFDSGVFGIDSLG